MLYVNYLIDCILRMIGPKHVRRYYGDTFLSPIEQFVSAGYDEFRLANLQLNEGSTVVIVGGYLGDTTSVLHKSYGSSIHVIEPISNFFSSLQKRFEFDSKIHLHQFAATRSEGNLVLYLAGDATGMVARDAVEITVPGKTLSSFMNFLDVEIDLLELNIEGGEYQVIPDLIDTNEISRIKSILVQFHNLELGSDYDRAVLRRDLRKTHNQVYCFDWVWEYWVRKF